PDPRSADRDAYSRGKAEAERLLLRMYREHGLPVCILRPGVVTGEGGLPFHSGAGNFINERHSIGWNKGQNPLPFVLASDVADAISVLQCVIYVRVAWWPSLIAATRLKI